MSENTENATVEQSETNHNTSLNLSAFYGIKAGMTRIFDDNGNHIPVTVVKLIPNVVSQIKTNDKDGYDAYQIAYGEKREKLLDKPTKGHLKKGGVEKFLTRFAELKEEAVDATNLGKEVSYENFNTDSYVDVSGCSKGKGFQGVMKRYNFSGGPAAHGSKFHRTTGSIGNRATPGRVFAQKKMPGQMGNKNRTTQNLKVVEVNTDQGYMLIKGSIPGSKNDFVKVAKAFKK